MKICLTIAGSDSISGAGIQQDLKVFNALGIYGTCVITAVTAQNTSKIYGIKFLDAKFIEQQIDAAMELKPDEVKIGLLGNAEICKVVYKKMKEYGCSTVLDTVLISTTGFKFYDDDFIASLMNIAKISKIITPNLKEAEILSGTEIKNIDDKKKAAEIMGNCVIKDEGEDLIFYNNKFEILKSDKILIKTHGSGCTFSSAIACHLAQGYEIFEAIKKANAFTYESIKHSIKNQNLNMAILNPFFETERCVVKENIIQALKILNECPDECNLKSLCPEVGINIAQITNFSGDISDIAEFSGRIFYDEPDKKLKAIGDVRFGLNKHLARALFAYIKCSENHYGAAINVKFSRKNLEKFKNMDFEISDFDRNDEPKENKLREGKTMEFGIENALIKNPKAELIYDRGGFGKEAMIRVFGRDAIGVAKKILNIFNGAHPFKLG
ncbi:MAG: bifunctional hydroxymethylpyrimidine kinase/phosphomethylpyrimidine kinase [Candidatus Altiarchaeum hamiconexum]|uniref:Bifunctional hydroxymethylpyrimidine kinase/phosphomethylpyrimidine kinase n=1 Tax=Candidatus Altarchaeum hamiconexum TaxID=1803513 RepID=A0A8J8CFE2_9ARCH|nr:bifunctional hydroxymethylpyrimidine kinase/phosphomethylpyrimidine kinase [Candidatus Altarchaeum hamiconexum]OIQ06090.1 MAG: bifunctional hydroxymethylpyrimidine kinase/phosphomethylpyrimidine kinase [Candidatus Altarchaeum sp. CG2_30_32_3053]PIN67074.1 MAG: bifunctional hydroxymethylpyrimidine kinase/phosphomethylpyrimidine kinase [Candidatus Altarchaeum sp. CG12_big_fil_rev_8_21_14_0_65_33_22]PIV28094.1 MAG: bifunctional hydroxymethylpyrimidine kinase/phosphomethylpyrimidine kinase [Candi